MGSMMSPDGVVFQLNYLEYILIHFCLFLMQFAGGFDAETMHAFEELRNLAHLLNKK